MHALWDIPELVQLIFGLVDRRTVTQLARVCRLFWLQALPLIWRSVDGLGPLLRLLPEDAVTRSLDGSFYVSLYHGRAWLQALLNGSSLPSQVRGPFTVTRALEKSDWDRFLMHLQHVRQFCYCVWEQHALLELAPYLPSTPIMQNLSSVQFSMRCKLEVDSELLGHFLLPSVTDVDVFVIFEEEDAQRSLHRLATAIKLPHLRSFSITVAFLPEDDVGSSVSHVLRSHQSIERLTLYIEKGHEIQEVLRLAGQLPHLRHFEMREYDGTVLSLDDDSFPALESLKLSTASHCLDPLLVWVPSEKIKWLRVEVQDRHELRDASGTPLADCFRAIGTFTHLKVLDVTLEVVTTWETVHHILDCKELQTFVITLRRGSGLELQERHLEQMGRAWRDLKTLRLQLPEGNGGRNSFMKLSYLRVIATEFRNLQALKINIDARAAAISRFNLPDLTVPPQYSLQELDVDVSLLDKAGEKIIGPLLASWWPNVREITYLDSLSNSSASYWSVVQKNYRSYIS